jgi:tetratricopeptide (TPR) repeat protein
VGQAFSRPGLLPRAASLTARLFPLCLVLAVSLNAGPGDKAFDKAEKALAAKQYDVAVGAFEESLTADPDSIRNASEYRMATMQRALSLQPIVKGQPHEGKPTEYDREIAFFDKLTKDHPKSPNALLNYGFCYVDKIPAAGTISQVILANNSLSLFTKSIEIKASWIALYTRGNSYLYWPKIFGHGPDAVADLERAYTIQKKQPRNPLHIRVFMALGDAYWKTDVPDKARAIWKEGLKQFPDSQPLKDRMSKDGDALNEYLDTVLDPNKRVNTDLRELWSTQ